MSDPSQFNIDRTNSGLWAITFGNPPINMFAPTTILELGALMTDIEADPSVKVVVFQSANPDFFVAHLDVAKAAAQPEVLSLWRDFVVRLSSAPVVRSRRFSAVRAGSVRVRAGMRHALREPAKRAVRPTRGRRWTGPGRWSDGLAPASGGSFASA